MLISPLVPILPDRELLTLQTMTDTFSCPTKATWLLALEAMYDTVAPAVHSSHQSQQDPLACSFFRFNSVSADQCVIFTYFSKVRSDILKTGEYVICLHSFTSLPLSVGISNSIWPSLNTTSAVQHYQQSRSLLEDQGHAGRQQLNGCICQGTALFYDCQYAVN